MVTQTAADQGADVECARLAGGFGGAFAGGATRLPGSFFARPVEAAAEALVGKWLVHCCGETVRALRITETEAYGDGPDSACHAHRGKTRRNAVLYDRPGTIYIYLCYGIHHLLNVVTGTVGDPQAVLVRACETAEGPGRLTRALGITTALNGCHLDETEAVQFWDDGWRPALRQLPRVGIGYAELSDQQRLRRYQAADTPAPLPGDAGGPMRPFGTPGK